jgi:DNA polymerase/3'-5' exonuclease PolX
METNFNNYVNDIKYLKQILEKNDKDAKDDKDSFNIKLLKGGVKKKNIKPIILKIFNAILVNYQSKKNNYIIKYKIDSYKKAIVAIGKFKKPIYSCDDIKDLEYIGKGMCEKVDEIARTGTLKAYEDIKNNKSIDAYSVLNEIWGFGDKIIKNIISKGIYTISDLKKRVKSGDVVLSHQQEVGLKFYKELLRKIPRKKITEITALLKKSLKAGGYSNLELYNAGSYRMGAKMCGDIDLIMTCEKGDELEVLPGLFKEVLIKENMLEDILLEGDKKSIYIIKPYFYKIDIAFILKEQLPWYLLYFGRSREFSKKIRGIASKRGFKLNEKGLFDKKTGNRIDFNPKDENEILDFFGLIEDKLIYK